MPWSCPKCFIRIKPGSSNASECAVSVLVQYAMHLHVVPHAAHLIPPSCLPNHSQRVLHCMCVLRTSGTRVWTCSLISGLLCIFSSKKKQHITSAAPMMIVSFSPSTHLVRAMYVPSPHIKTVLYCACNFAHLAQVCPDDLCVCAGCKFQVSTLTLSRVCPYPLSLVVIRMFHTSLSDVEVSFLTDFTRCVVHVRIGGMITSLIPGGNFPQSLL